MKQLTLRIPDELYEDTKKELKQIAKQLEEQAAQNLTLANKLNKVITQLYQRPY